MRAALVAGSGLAALALWVWLTGPGTSLPLALGGGLFALLACRLAYRLLTPRSLDHDTAPDPAPGTQADTRTGVAPGAAPPTPHPVPPPAWRPRQGDG
ncbi:hypothetical protein [Teichococcus cervicalis]|uniref:Uncharacterized protein n=1 Tax=Pseudoroseomonas cervicalis ATCC 49957 TaxID=525371 RepID=D5RRX6_9PROT|nr:hypothetical protein [Pseudoroseomonas cervicalis]EFH09937.1 hypothetical protein HMPREF0731_3838 [Pseudoroseomonas cervicalis ATCC 49957]